MEVKDISGNDEQPVLGKGIFTELKFEVGFTLWQQETAKAMFQKILETEFYNAPDHEPVELVLIGVRGSVFHFQAIFDGEWLVIPVEYRHSVSEEKNRYEVGEPYGQS